MKKNILVMAFGMAAMLVTSCGGGTTKSVVDNSYYNNPQPYQRQTQPQAKPTLPERVAEIKASHVEKAASEVKNGCFRGYGLANDYDQGDARKDALRYAQTEIAELLERAIEGTTDEFRKKGNSLSGKKFNEKKLEEHIQTSIAEVIRNCRVVDYQAYKLSDGTIDYEICVEMSKPAEKVVEEVYDGIKREEIFEIDFDRDEYVKKNMERIQENHKIINEKRKQK